MSGLSMWFKLLNLCLGCGSTADMSLGGTFSEILEYWWYAVYLMRCLLSSRELGVRVFSVCEAV